MKLRFVILLAVCKCLYPCYANANKTFHECVDTAVQAKREYFQTTYQLKTTENKKRNSNNQTELVTRNMCLNNFMNIHLNCAIHKCFREPFPLLFMNRNLTGEQICGFLDSVDCLNDNISDINQFLHDAGDTYTDMFLLDMDKIIADIKSNNASLTLVDMHKEVCYSVDNNGDTIWHAFVETENPLFCAWFNQCVSVLNSDQKQYLYHAMLLSENKSDKTAIQLAYTKHKFYYLEHFKIIGNYFTQEKIDCQPYVDSVSEQSGIDKINLDVLCMGTPYKLW